MFEIFRIFKNSLNIITNTVGDINRGSDRDFIGLSPFLFIDILHVLKMMGKPACILESCDELATCHV